jgi:hypothetical protein
MKTDTIIMKNAVNGEQWICDDSKKIKVIEGIVYLTVHKPGSSRHMLMRKDSLVPIKDKTLALK